MLDADFDVVGRRARERAASRSPTAWPAQRRAGLRDAPIHPGRGTGGSAASAPGRASRTVGHDRNVRASAGFEAINTCVTAGDACTGPRRRRGAAEAHEFTPSWGYGFIDDKPFSEPPPSGAFLPARSVYPRGYIRDTVLDGHDVAVGVRLHARERRRADLLLGQREQLQASRRSRARHLAVPDVLPALRLLPLQPVERRRGGLRDDPPHRPAGATLPAPTPTATPGGGRHRRPADADRDGVPVRPTARTSTPPSSRARRRSPGTGSTTTAPAATRPPSSRPRSGASGAASAAGARRPATVSEAPQGAVVEVRCHGARCPFKRRPTSVDAKGKARLRRFFKHRSCDRRSRSRSGSPIRTGSAASAASRSSASPFPRCAGSVCRRARRSHKSADSPRDEYVCWCDAAVSEPRSRRGRR